MRKLIILDLDNTLYDWVASFVPSFYGMVDSAADLLGCDRERLLDDLRDVHRRHHDSEHPFALLETAAVNEAFPGASRAELKERLDPAFYAFNSIRKKTLREYPGVSEGLSRLHDDGYRIVAHTESNVLAAFYRLEKLNLLRFFECVYCREQTALSHPNSNTAKTFEHRLKQHNLIPLHRHKRKPDPEVLREIIESVSAKPSQAIYVGDSLTRDMKMAVDVGVTSIWAKYGTRHAPGSYEKLVRVTHWTDEDVAREKALSVAAKSVTPDYVAENGFSEVVDFILRDKMVARNVAIRLA